MSDVYFLETRNKDEILNELPDLFNRAFPKSIKADDFTAIKVHFGEYGHKTFLHPAFAKKIAEIVKQKKAKPFVTDSNALYKGMRYNSVDHLENAWLNGFTHEYLKAPVIIADGLHGHNFNEVEIDKKHFRKVKIASEIYSSDSVIFATHFKGHMLAGFGGSIKNIAMGCSSRAGKQQQHSSVKPRIAAEKCIICKECAKWCPENAINYEKGHAEIDYQKCVGCNECVASCPTGAIGVRWDTSAIEFQEKMAEYALGTIKNKRACFINFLINITPHCDCMNNPGKPIMEDIGVLAAKDPVAIDQASLDLVNNKLNKKNIFQEIHGFDNTVQLKYGEEINLGERKYKLIKI
ncbi:DUF362 domain-containing protein [Candidatus Woesearchaeota archaeon]|nr:DUF362 domain-containing protein [Candidatus Woesearchaeota archaeon]